MHLTKMTPNEIKFGINSILNYAKGDKVITVKHIGHRWFKNVFNEETREMEEIWNPFEPAILVELQTLGFMENIHMVATKNGYECVYEHTDNECFYIP